MPIVHKNLTDPELHEPKGVSTAPAGSIYVADGLGSGQWLNILRNVTFTGDIKDVSSTEPFRFVSTTKGNLVRVSYVLNGTSAAHNVDILINGSVVTTIAIPSGSAGQSVVSALSGLVTVGDLVEIKSDGTGTAGVTATVSLLIAEDIV